MKTIYIAGPYTAKTHWEVYKNIERAREVIVRLCKEGWAPVCPHTNSYFMGGALESSPTADYEAWLAVDFAILKVCDAVYMMNDWKKSQGAVREHALAQQLNKEIIYASDTH